MPKILLVDDEEMTREMLRHALELRGYEVVEAGNGEEALKLNRTDPCPLVITDILMPDKEGLETIMDLRREFPDSKIIAISGGGAVGRIDYLEAAQKFGAQATFQKPFELAKLFAAVESLLEEEPVSS